MKVIQTGFKGLVVLEPNVVHDSRGMFFEAYNKRVFEGLGLDMEFVQDNQSKSMRGVLRGLHYQMEPYSQSKLVRVLTGEILDVAVDLRKSEPTFGKYFSVRLSAENARQLFIPRGFAHGFVVLSEESEVLYKCDQYYHPQAETGIAYNDPSISIDWVLQEEELLLSPKDKVQSEFLKARFLFQ
jgi:dTDP-4-dehydrorhamnose 3,5-epimerase